MDGSRALHRGAHDADAHRDPELAVGMPFGLGRHRVSVLLVRLLVPPACTPAPTVSLRVSGYRILIDYEAPNYFCQNTGDWPPFYTCTNDIELSSDRITLSQSGYPIRRAWIYYEKGTWDTGIDLPSCAAQTYTAAIKYVCGSGATAVTSIDQLIQANAPACQPPPKDRRSCPAGGGGGAPGIGVGQPINVGSGDVSLTIPLFTIAQSPLSLAFNLAYHSLDPKYPALVSAPVGAGWTHPYAQTLRPVPPDTSVLYHVTAEGYESEYTSSGSGTWTASSPGELRGTVTQSGGQYRLTDLDGTVTAFDVTTGAWLSTTDRWGNSISGTYSGGNLTTLTDSEGRQVTLSYTAGQLTQITLPDSGLWRLGYTGSQLTSIFDPLHTGALAWKTFAYQGTSRLLTGVSDEAGVLLESHGYDGQERGTSSASAAGRNNVTVEYDVPPPASAA